MLTLRIIPARAAHFVRSTLAPRTPVMNSDNHYQHGGKEASRRRAALIAILYTPMGD